MCGIMGFIGHPRSAKASKLSYQLASKLLSETVVRGSHATGAYALLPPKEGEDKNRCFIFKLDAASPQYVKTKPWKGIQGSNPFLLLGHCRFYTHGSPQDHTNNHPHVSDDHRLALIHNGVITGYEGLKKTFPCKGECDSEVILRIIESEDDVISGIKRVFNVVTTGTMSCMVCQYNQDGKVADFYAFRNDGNPLVWVDLRKQLGQIFMASTEDIAEKAMKSSGMPKSVRDQSVIEIPSHEIWHCSPEKLEWDVTKLSKPVPVITDPAGYYGRRQWNGDTRFSGVQTTSTTTDIETESCKNDRKKLRALIDTIVENLTEIDEEIALNNSFGLDQEEMEKALETVAWELEQVVNPAFNGRDDQVVDSEFFD